MPYGTVNLLRGVSPTETPVTCTACVGTFILEFAALSRLTGDETFEDTARRALRALWKTRSDIGLVTSPLSSPLSASALPFIFGLLSRHSSPSSPGLRPLPFPPRPAVQVGNHIDVQSQKWVAQDAGIGAGVDSYFEYLVKGAVMLQDEELLDMFLGKCSV